MSGKGTGGQQVQAPSSDAQSGDQNGGAPKTQGKRGNGAQRLKQKK